MATQKQLAALKKARAAKAKKVNKTPKTSKLNGASKKTTKKTETIHVGAALDAVFAMSNLCRHCKHICICVGAMQAKCVTDLLKEKKLL